MKKGEKMSKTSKPLLVIASELKNLNAIVYSVKTNMFNDDYLSEDVQNILYHVYSRLDILQKELEIHFFETRKNQ